MTEPMTRLTAQHPPSDALKFAAELVRSDVALPPVDARILDRARRRLRTGDAREARPLWRPAVAVAVLALSSFATAAVVRWTPLWPLLRSREAVVSVPLRPAPPVAQHAVEPTPVHAEAPAVQPDRSRGPRKPQRTAPHPLAATPVEETPPVQVVAPAPAVGGSLAPSEGPLAGESALLGDALRALNLRHDAAASLHLLETYDARYPAGALRREAFVARIDSLLALGLRRQALELLVTAGELSALPKARELEVLRGELRAQAGDCAGAASDFNAALAARGPFAERALWGLAACGSRPHLQRYLAEYPNGTFAAQARAALEP